MLKFTRGLLVARFCLAPCSRRPCCARARRRDRAPRGHDHGVGRRRGDRGARYGRHIAGVVRDAETASEALSANSAAMTEVLAALKEQGIAEKDLQTTDFSIQPKYKQETRTDGTYEAPVIVGYTVSNGLTVRVRDLFPARHDHRPVGQARRQPGWWHLVHQ